MMYIISIIQSAALYLKRRLSLQEEPFVFIVPVPAVGLILSFISRYGTALTRQRFKIEYCINRIRNCEHSCTYRTWLVSRSYIDIPEFVEIACLQNHRIIKH